MTAGAAGNVAAAKLVAWAQFLKLDKVFKLADAAWRKQRTSELALHLRESLLEPLFSPWFEQLDRLEQAPRETCRQACRDLSELARLLATEALPTPVGCGHDG